MLGICYCISWSKTHILIAFCMANAYNVFVWMHLSQQLKWMSARQFKKKIHIFPLLYVTQHHRGKKKKIYREPGPATQTFQMSKGSRIYIYKKKKDYIRGNRSLWKRKRGNYLCDITDRLPLASQSTRPLS